uniref:Uncharacterized protein n=1 Tax=Anguilla anguilla TaxID=7936 RepID=A0A0E9X0Z7_ANGAN
MEEVKSVFCSRGQCRGWFKRQTFSPRITVLENGIKWLHPGATESHKAQLDDTSVPTRHLKCLQEESLCCSQTTNACVWRML